MQNKFSFYIYRTLPINSLLCSFINLLGKYGLSQYEKHQVTQHIFQTVVRKMYIWNALVQALIIKLSAQLCKPGDRRTNLTKKGAMDDENQ